MADQLAYGANNDLEADFCLVLDQHELAKHADVDPLVLSRYLIRQLDNFRETLREVDRNDYSRKQGTMGSTSSETGNERTSSPS